MKTIKTQSNGKEVEYRIYEFLNEIIVDVRVNKKKHTTAKPEPLNKIMDGRQIYGHIGTVYVSKLDIWNEIWTAYIEAKAQLKSTDEYKIKRLREQREKLAFDVKYASDELHESEQRQVEAAMQGRSYRYDSDKLKLAITTAKAALIAFDESNPEIIAGIRQERNERNERNIWN